jgi:hypothetical protein
MFSMKLLIAFTMLTGIAAEQCSLGDFGVEDFADKVTVTNTSDGADAFVAIKFNHGQVTMYVEAGKSRTAIALASTKYTAKVTEPGNTDYGDYRNRLLELRNSLIGMTAYAGFASADQLLNAWNELSLVQAALAQMTDSTKVQSCSGTLKTDVTSQVTLEWAKTSDGAALWVLDCS